jgi:hypothetical protein
MDLLQNSSPALTTPRSRRVLVADVGGSRVAWRPSDGASDEADEAPSNLSSAPVGQIRFFRQDDADRVTDLFVKTFRRGARTDRAAVARCFVQTYLGGPNGRDAAGSLVHVDEKGVVNGFLGVLKIGMEIGGRPLRVGILGAAMAAEPKKNPAIGVRLALACRSMPLDLVVSDTAIPHSLEFARALRFELLATESLEWMKIFRPAATAALLLARRIPVGERFLKALASVAEPVAKRFYDPGDPGASGCTVPAEKISVLDIEGFLTRAEELTQDRLLRPCWRSEQMRWTVEQAALKTKNGPMRLCEVVARDGRLIGVFILYAGRGDVAHALQIIARPGCARAVVASLVRLAESEGAPAIRGVADPRVLEGLIGVPGVFYHHGAVAVAFSRDREVRAALSAGKALIGGLVGERWSRLIADPFN